jgi:hypothetical protein
MILIENKGNEVFTKATSLNTVGKLAYNRQLEQEILKLKGETTKPKIKPSSMDKDGDSESNTSSSKKKKGPRRSKKGNLTIDETQIIQPDEIPKGSRFKGYQERVIQDITFQTAIYSIAPVFNV